MRVVQVLCSEAFGGTERYVVTLANGLAERGCEAIVLGGPPGRMRRELSASVEMWRRARGVAEALAGLARLGRADIVHAHMTHAEFAAVLARPITGGQLVVTRHFAARRGSRAAGRLAAVAVRRSTALQIATSQYVAAAVDGPCRVIRPGVPRVEVADSEREPVVIVVAQLRPEKSTDVAVRAFAKARLAESGWRLEIVGDGPRRQSLEQLAGELALTESCRFRGSSEDVRSHLRRAAIMLAPASGEPFGLAVVEAMASAVPVVAAGSGGHMETVGVCAEPVLFSPGDVAEAARQLRHLAEDPARRRQYGRRLQALQRERFSSDRQIDETLACYEELVARV